ncbi:MAG: response regulator [Deferribacteres bacterium]|nr:response regulator [Deferribacteres bacterium]
MPFKKNKTSSTAVFLNGRYKIGDKGGVPFLFLLLLFVLQGLPITANGIEKFSPYKPSFSNPFDETWRWRSYPELVGRDCRCVVEDANGIMWFGVSGGVMRYDGLQWDYYPLQKDSSDIPVVSLYSTKDDVLYAATSKGIFRFVEAQWHKLDVNLEFGDPSIYFYNKIPILQSSDSSIWIGSKKGLIQLKNGSLTLYQPNIILKNVGGRDQAVDALKEFDVYSIFADNQDEMWLGLRDGKVYRCQLNEDGPNAISGWKRIDTEPKFSPLKYPMIKKKHDGSIYIASSEYDGGINVFEGTEWKHTNLKDQFYIDEFYTDILELQDGSICLAGLGRIFIEHKGEWKMYESPTFPFSSNRLVIYQSADESLWLIGLSNEVWKIDLSRQTWATYKGLNFQTEDASGDYWFISFDGNIVQYQQATQRWIRYNKSHGVLDSPIAAMATKGGKIWIYGSHQQIAATAFFNGTKWIKQLHPQLGWCIDRRAGLEAIDGSLWFGSSSDFLPEKGQRGGFVRYKNIDYENPDSIVFEYHHPDQNFHLGSVYGISQTKDGVIWAGQLGFYSFDPNSNKWQNITDPPELDGSFIDCMKTAPNGDLWIGTRTNGLFWRKEAEAKWYHFTTNNGLSSNAIINIYADSGSSVWVTSDKDISHFDGESWMPSGFKGFFKNFRDGISINKTRDGSFWINQNPPVWYRKSLLDKKLSPNFYEQFRVIKYFPDKTAPETKITFSQEKISEYGNVMLSWIGNDPWKTTPTSNLQYTYRIDDNPWSSFSNKTSDIFLAVAPGEHTFSVKARDMDLNVDASPAQVAFFVEYPVWQRTWFILLIFLLLSIIAASIIFLFKRNKTIREISETKIRLFANISHELRTPLVLIVEPIAKILQSSYLDKRLVQPLNLVNRNAHRLLRLVNQVLDFRKMEADQLKFEPYKGDITRFLYEEVQFFEEAAASKGIFLKFAATSAPVKTWFDYDKIEKVIFNLLSNALKFTRENGTISVQFSLENLKKSRSIPIHEHTSVRFKQWIRIEVTDTGIGISPDNLEKIFNRFYQVEDRAKATIGGTGIGLSVVKELLKIHHGQISAESEVGKGTTFVLQIPLIEENALDGIIDENRQGKPHYMREKYPEKDTAALDSNGTRKNGKDKFRIMIVEDNYDMREYIRGEMYGDYQILLARDGIQGFEKALKENPDLIISDIMMPRMDGIEFCKKIKSDERTSHIAVILLTERSSQHYKLEGLETGADDYLTKPFLINELRLRVNNIMESRKKFREQFVKSMQLEPSNIQITSIDQKFIKRAIEIIEENIADPDFSVERFSHMVGVSRVGLYNKLKTLTNHSVQEFIFMVKLKRAAQLLRKSGMSVTEICYEVGFKDPSHFSKLFKRQYGISPKKYKTKNTDKLNDTPEF